MRTIRTTLQEGTVFDEKTQIFNAELAVMTVEDAEYIDQVFHSLLEVDTEAGKRFDIIETLIRLTQDNIGGLERLIRLQQVQITLLNQRIEGKRKP